MIDKILLQLISLIPQGVLGFFILFVVIAVTLVILGKGADILVDQAVILSMRWGIPKMLIGATIVSLGTTLPEVTVSVMSALKGSPGLALGNAVGSIICDTGLILGIAALIQPLPFKKEVVSKQGWIQFNAGLLLIVVSFVFAGNFNVFHTGGRIPQFMGFVFLLLLAVYLIYTVKSAKNAPTETPTETSSESLFIIILKLALGIALVIISSKILIPTVQETALRFKIPETIIAATLVAFGTSLPELITAITSAKKGHGDLAIGNVIGADILNVLFVIGLSTAVTKGGLFVDVSFFTTLFPAMIFVLLVFRSAILFSKGTIRRPFGIVLLAAYIIITVVSYITDSVV